MVVAVTHESNMASYFPEVGNLNGTNADMCSDVAGPSSSQVAARGIFLSFQTGQMLRSFTISPTTNTNGRHLEFERDYNYHTAFRACYVIMHTVYYWSPVKVGQHKRALRKIGNLDEDFVFRNIGLHT